MDTLAMQAGIPTPTTSAAASSASDKQQQQQPASQDSSIQHIQQLLSSTASNILSNILKKQQPPPPPPPPQQQPSPPKQAMPQLEAPQPPPPAEPVRFNLPPMPTPEQMQAKRSGQPTGHAAGGKPGGGSKAARQPRGGAADRMAAADPSDPKLAALLAKTRRDQFANKADWQERIAAEVKLTLRPLYTARQIDKNDYKEILKKAVTKISRSNAQDVQPDKTREFVSTYVDKLARAKKHEIRRSQVVSSSD
ncbi:hypothetical protein BOX15_Mlig006627g3 [Macrostomum lignano]|uniref:SFR19-like C-terminal domain-containing protein n=2 Tax=Macrostomum lignano TaxID=282301 RepID=A0A267F3J9_9PLAT|nr:hypothetical protein BOX15_Mlig006627g3 [Macrostomum lignano]